MTINYDPEQLLQKIKNQIEPDKQFQKNLRGEILHMSKNLNTQKEDYTMSDTIKKLFVAFAGVVAIALMVMTQNGGLTGTKVAARQGFGVLPSLLSSGGQGGDRPQSGGGATMAIPETAVSTDKSLAYGFGGGAGGTGTVIAPDGEYIPPKVTYGLDVNLPELPEEILVIKDNPLQAGSALTKYVANLTNLSFISKLGAANLENISFRPANSNYGISLEQFGRFNIWRNITGEYREIRVEEFPSDAEIITVAENFLREFGIDASSYGSPRVDNYWKSMPRPMPLDANLTQADTTRFAPPYASVIYPMTINDLPAVSWSGDDDPGILVSIDALHRQGTSINGRFNIRRSQSLYPARTKTEIETEALAGGLSPLWGWYGPQPQLTPEQETRRQQLQVRFTTAKLGYVQQYKYNQQNSLTDVYWIPVVALTGTYTDESGTEQRYGTIVPAIQGDFFDQPPVQIMPEAQLKG